jgi:hypothetical protein
MIDRLLDVASEYHQHEVRHLPRRWRWPEGDRATPFQAPVPHQGQAADLDEDTNRRVQLRQRQCDVVQRIASSENQTHRSRTRRMNPSLASR